jgi:Glycosyl hydrolase family 26
VGGTGGAGGHTATPDAGLGTDAGGRGSGGAAGSPPDARVDVGAVAGAGGSQDASPPTPTPADGGASDLLVPAQGALLGAFVDGVTFDQFEAIVGRRLAIIHNFFGWTDDWVARARTDVAAGRTPLITWETWLGGAVGIPLDDIISGVYDTMINTRAQAARAVGQKFFLRWGHEMNGNWYPWDGFHNGASTAANAKYIATYRHIHDIFTAAGATNVIWVFSPNVDSVPGDAWNQWSNYYPGDAYVDWMAFDGYNWGLALAGAAWQTFPTIASRIYAGLAAKGKPIMIPETASSELGGDKAAWIAGMLPALRTSFPAIKALVWFDMNKETDWRVDSSPPAATNFRALALDPYFNP